MNIFTELLLCGVAGNRREKRRLQHLARCADKKESRHARAERGKNVRPFVRFFLDARVSDELENVPPSVLIQVGDDTETYEPEQLRLHREWMDEAMLGDEYYGVPFDDYDPTNYDDGWVGLP